MKNVTFLKGFTSLLILGFSGWGSVGVSAASPPAASSASGAATAKASTSAAPAAEAVALAIPAPVATAISPNSATVDSAATTITLTGTGFVSSSQVRWNGSNLKTTYGSATSLTAVVASSDLTTAGAFDVTVKNPTPGGGISSPLTFTVNNLTPTLSTVAPAQVVAGGGNLSVKATGTGFVKTSVAQWDGVALATTFNSATTLTVVIPKSDIAVEGTHNITVVNPTPGGGKSNAFSFTVDNPSPTLTSISPIAAAIGSADLTVKVVGKGFVSTSVAQWDGTALATTYSSATALTFVIPQSDLTAVGTHKITIKDPTPGGGASTALVFTVNNPAPTLSSVSPTSAFSGSAAVTVTATGTGFVSSSVAQLDGTALTTTPGTATTLTFVIPQAKLATAGAHKITIETPAPGGGTSKSVAFTVAAANIANARVAVSLLRGIASAVSSNGSSESVSIQAAIQNQVTGAKTGVQGPTAFGKRFKFLGQLLGMKQNAEPLSGLAPGTFNQVYDNTNFSQPFQLVRTGSGGKSWVVTCTVQGDAAYGCVATFTPGKQIATFGLTAASGGFSFLVTNSADSKVNWSGKLTATYGSGSDPTAISLTGTMNDSALSKVLTFSLTASGTLSTVSGVKNPYSSMTFSGTITSQFGAVQVTNLAWEDFSGIPANVTKSVTLGSLAITTGFTPAASLTINAVSVTFATPVATNNYSSTKPTSISLGSAELKGSGYDAKLTNCAVTLTQDPTTQDVIPTSIQGQLSYTSPHETLSGSVSGSLKNPLAVDALSSAMSTAVGGSGLSGLTTANFPVANLTITGSLTPTATKVTYAVNMTVATGLNNSGTSGVATLTIANLQAGTESLKGTVTATFAPTTGTNLTAKPAVTVSLTSLPGGDLINLNNSTGTIVGTITSGGTVVANIGPANSTTIAMPDLGNATIILYADKSFESAASILP